MKKTLKDPSTTFSISTTVSRLKALNDYTFLVGAKRSDIVNASIDKFLRSKSK